MSIQNDINMEKLDELKPFIQRNILLSNTYERHSKKENNWKTIVMDLKGRFLNL